MSCSCFSRTMPPRTKQGPQRKWFTQYGLACTEPWPQSHRKLVGWIEGLTVSQPLIAQHQWATSLMFLWLNGSKSLQPVSKTTRKAFPGVRRLLQQHANSCDFWNEMSNYCMCARVSRYIWLVQISCVFGWGEISLGPSYPLLTNKAVFVLLFAKQSMGILSGEKKSHRDRERGQKTVGSKAKQQTQNHWSQADNWWQTLLKLQWPEWHTWQHQAHWIQIGLAQDAAVALQNSGAQTLSQRDGDKVTAKVTLTSWLELTEPNLNQRRHLANNPRRDKTQRAGESRWVEEQERWKKHGESVKWKEKEGGMIKTVRALNPTSLHVCSSVSLWDKS